MHDILVIDDELDVRDAIQRVLVGAGYAVRTAGDVTGAMAEIRRAPADVVITDIIMPQTHGVDAINSIRKEFPGVRIIAISGGGNFSAGGYQPTAITTSAYLAAAQRAGAHFLMTKPFESEDLIQAVEEVLGLGHA
jgi:DNA-binding NtrC family response regulator